MQTVSGHIFRQGPAIYQGSTDDSLYVNEPSQNRAMPESETCANETRVHYGPLTSIATEDVLLSSKLQTIEQMLLTTFITPSRTLEFTKVMRTPTYTSKCFRLGPTHTGPGMLNMWHSLCFYQTLRRPDEVWRAESLETQS